MSTIRETPTEQARRVANYLLTQLPPDRQATITAQAHAAGLTWLGPTPIYHTDDDILTPADAARLVHTTPAILRTWVAAQVLPRTGKGYRVADVLNAHHEIRRRAATRRRTPTPGT